MLGRKAVACIKPQRALSLAADKALLRNCRGVGLSRFMLLERPVTFRYL